MSHYLIGVVFAGLLIVVYGTGWIDNPILLPALIVGLATVLAPFLLMQPGMGAGVASANTPKPWYARFHSVATHMVFGFGLFLSAKGLQLIGFSLSV